MVFKTAKSLVSEVKAPGAKKKERETTPISGCEKLAHLDAIIKAATAAKEILVDGLAETVFDNFMTKIKANPNVQPDNFYGAEGLAEVNFQLKKRSTNSPLNEEEIALLAEEKIKPLVTTVTPKLFAINPEYASDQKLLEKVEKALAKIVPEDFIVIQDEVSKSVIDDSVLAKCLLSKDAEIIKLATSLAFKPTLKLVNNDDLVKTVKSILEKPEEVAPAPTKRAKK